MMDSYFEGLRGKVRSILYFMYLMYSVTVPYKPHLRPKSIVQVHAKVPMHVVLAFIVSLNILVYNLLI